MAKELVAHEPIVLAHAKHVRPIGIRDHVAGSAEVRSTKAMACTPLSRRASSSTVIASAIDRIAGGAERQPHRGLHGSTRRLRALASA